MQLLHAASRLTLGHPSCGVHLMRLAGAAALRIAHCHDALQLT